MTADARDDDQRDPSASRRADAVARECAQRVFDRPLVLEAGAGTGKTSALVARVVAWCIGPGWDRWESATLRRSEQLSAQAPPDAVVRDAIAVEVLSRVAAITFTEAAAAEMAERAGETFAAVARGELRPGLLESALPDDADERAARAGALLGALDHLVVRTIHAWCRGLLARHPLESGLHPNFLVDADMRLQAEVVREVVEETVRDAYASADSPLLQLALEGHGAHEVEGTLALLVAEGVDASVFRSTPFAPERVERHVAGLGSALHALFECDDGRLAGVPQRAKKTHAALQALEVTRGLVGAFKPAGPDSLDSLGSLCDGLTDAWQPVALSRIEEWSKGKLIVGETEALGDDAGGFTELARALLPWIRSLVGFSPRRLEVGRCALGPMLEAVTGRLRARGIATFASLLSAVHELLEQKPDVCRRVQSELDQLLVDEFQDTDSLQCSIVRHLALSGPESQRPGLFLVGDPKQSIYGWRSADLAAYDGFVREIERAGGEVHSLSVNFRSAPAILDEVERVMEPVMLQRTGLQPRFRKLDASPSLLDEPGYRDGTRAPVEYWVTWGFQPVAGDEDDSAVVTDIRAADATRIEADALADDLVSLHQSEGVAWRDMAVLFRGTGELDDYLSALRARGVPYAVERDRNYYRRREVIDAAAWVRCILDPHDQLALVTALRSPAVGVPDAALIPLWSRGFPALVADLAGPSAEPLAELGEIARAVAALLDGGSEQADIPGIERVRGWESSLCAMLETLAILRDSFDRDAADVFVERLRTLSLLEVSEAARYLGSFRVSNLDRFFRELRAGLVSGDDPQAILRRLRSDIAQGRDEEEQRPVGEGEDAVPVMTIHKAKGLDFEHVYLVQLHKRSRPDAPPATAAMEWEGAWEYRFFSQSTLGFESARAASRRVEAAERVRTLYVAMTRAKRRLVMLGSWDASPEPIAFERAASHIELLGGRLSSELERLEGSRGSATRGETIDLVSSMQACAAAGETFRDAGGVRWVFPALRPRSATERVARERVPLPAPGAIAREHSVLASLQSAAEARMKLSWGGRASQDSQGLLAAEPPGPNESPSERHAASGSAHALAARAASIASGIAIHSALEDLDLDAGPQEEIARQRDSLEEKIARFAAKGELTGVAPAALERAEALLDRFAAGPLSQRLWAIGPHIAARELEVWLPSTPPEEATQADRDEGLAAPLRYIAGVIDLVYRDPADGEWVVADYKSDRVSGRDVDERAASYAPQGAIYTRAVQEALGLASLPRFELWFLDADVIVVSG